MHHHLRVIDAHMARAFAPTGPTFGRVAANGARAAGTIAAQQGTAPGCTGLQLAS